MLSRERAVACLLVDDVDRAVVYYRDVLGFVDQAHLSDRPSSALVCRGAAQVLLQRAPSGAVGLSHRRFGGLQWDALLFVDDVERLAGDLRARGARIQVGIGITSVSDRTLEVRDEWGNVMAFAEQRVGPRAAVRSAVSAALPPPLVRGARSRRRRAEERPELARMRAFVRSLKTSPDPFYMFFTSGLLHWVHRAARLVPRDVNLVLVGSALPLAEQAWLRTHLDRPLHVVELGVDDNTVWDFLFECSPSSFGYLDIDCFVLEPQLFEEMTETSPDVAVNGIWTYSTDSGLPIACTHFAHINMDVLAELRARGSYIGPANHDWDGATISLLHPRDYCRVPTAHQRRQLLKVLPPDGSGRPVPPGGSPFFDTLVAYQVAAYAEGFRTRAVRPLAHRTQGTLDSGARVWQQDISDEVVHVGGVSYYQRWFHEPRLRGMYLAAEHALMAPIVDELPPAYAGRLRSLGVELTQLGLPPEQSADLVRAHLVEERGLRPDTASRIILE